MPGGPKFQFLAKCNDIQILLLSFARLREFKGVIWMSTELTEIRDMAPSVPLQYHHGIGFLGTLEFLAWLGL